MCVFTWSDFWKSPWVSEAPGPQGADPNTPAPDAPPLALPPPAARLTTTPETEFSAAPRISQTHKHGALQGQRWCLHGPQPSQHPPPS